MSLFEDAEFPATRASLYFNAPSSKDDVVASWRRLRDIAESEVANGVARLFVDGTAAGDVVQGALGDCWFLGALSVVAMRSDLLAHVLCGADVQAGRYSVRFHKAGEWRTVVVDDLVPCSKAGLPAYGRAHQLDELWVAVVEKAYAKLHRSYQALEGGNIAEALVDLTGGAPEEIELDDDDGRRLVASGELWAKLCDYHAEQYLLGCAFIDDGAAELDTGSGVLQNHAYGIVRVAECEGHRLVCCRNPWRQTEWTGDWSDKSPLWTPSMRRALQLEVADDGVFWISVADFARQFNRVYVVRLYQDDVGEKWQLHRVASELVGDAAAGCINNAGWFKNPQFAIVPTADTDVYISIAQPDLRLEAAKALTNTKRQYEHKIGFCLVRVADAAYALAAHPQASDVVCSTVFLNVRQLAKDVKLKRGEQYVLVPSTFKAGEQTPFVLEVHARRPVAFKKLDLRPVAKYSGAWAGASAGGCMNHATWVDNPQLAVTLDGDADLSIALQQELAAGAAPTFAGFLVVRSEFLLADRPRAADVVFESQITNTARVVAAAPHVPAGTYVVVPSTFEPGVEARFSLELAPAARVKSIAPAPERHAATIRSAWKGVTAGGCPNHATWRNSPQFILDAPAQRSGKLELTLTLATAVAKHVGFYIFRADGEQRRVWMAPDEIVAKSAFTTGTASADLSLDAAHAPYLVLPCTFEAGVDADFTLKAFSAVATLRPLAGAHLVTMQHRWHDGVDGGCTNHATWPKNPKFALHSSVTGRIQLLLTVTGEPTGLGIMIVDSNGDNLTRTSILAESELLMGDETHLSYEVKANETVYVMPVTFDAHVHRAFELSLYSSFVVQFGQ
jgi:hypothetical protein